MWYAIVAILILIADQGLKYWVTVNIALCLLYTSDAADD